MTVTKNSKRKRLEFLDSPIFPPLVTQIVIWILFWLFVPHFGTVRTVSGIVSAASINAIIVIGVTMLMISGEFDLGMSVYGFDWDPDYNVFWLSSYSLDYGLNWPGYANPDFDDLYLAQFYAATDEERNEYLYLIQEHLHEEVPWIQLQHFNVFDAYRNDRFEFNIQNSMWESWHWWGIYGVEAVE